MSDRTMSIATEIHYYVFGEIEVVVSLSDEVSLKHTHTEKGVNRFLVIRSVHK